MLKVDAGGLLAAAAEVDGLVGGFGCASLPGPPESGHPGLDTALGDGIDRWSAALVSRLADVAGLGSRLRESAKDMAGTEEDSQSDLRDLGRGLR